MDILTGVFLRFVGLFAYLFGFWEEGGGCEFSALFKLFLFV